MKTISLKEFSRENIEDALFTTFNVTSSRSSYVSLARSISYSYLFPLNSKKGIIKVYKEYEGDYTEYPYSAKLYVKFNPENPIYSSPDHSIFSLKTFTHLRDERVVNKSLKDILPPSYEFIVFAMRGKDIYPLYRMLNGRLDKIGQCDIFYEHTERMKYIKIRQDEIIQVHPMRCRLEASISTIQFQVNNVNTYSPVISVHSDRAYNLRLNWKTIKKDKLNVDSVIHIEVDYEGYAEYIDYVSTSKCIEPVCSDCGGRLRDFNGTLVHVGSCKKDVIFIKSRLRSINSDTWWYFTYLQKKSFINNLLQYGDSELSENQYKDIQEMLSRYFCNRPVSLYITTDDMTGLGRIIYENKLYSLSKAIKELNKELENGNK